MIDTPAFAANELERSSLPLSSWIQHSQAYAQQQAGQSSNDMSAHQQHVQPASVPPPLQSRKPIWMTSAAVIESLPLGNQHVAAAARSVSPAGSMSPPPPPPTSTGSPVVNAAMINAAAAHLMASARSGPLFPDDSPFASPHTPLDSFFRPANAAATAATATAATAIASADSTSTIGTPNGASLFNPFEQRYIADFLNKFTFEGHEFRADPATTATTATTTAASARSHSSSNGGKHGDGAYPSPEPNRSDHALKLLASYSIDGQDSSTAASSAVELNLSKSNAPNALPGSGGIAARTPDSIAGVKTEAPSPNAPTSAEVAPSSAKRKRATAEAGQRKRSSVDVSANHAAASPSMRAASITSDGPSGGHPCKKELLTEEQKRLNHIRSEQKRRDAIRTGFQDLGEMVPALRGARYSKSVMLDETVTWIAKLEADCQKMQHELDLLEARRARQQC